MIEINKEKVSYILRPKSEEVHKGDMGKVLLRVGSSGMTGAAILSAGAALRAGSGLVYIDAPSDIHPILQVSVPEAICGIPAEHDAACAGPGIGKSREAAESVRKMIEADECPLVLDADALNIIAADDMFSLVRNRKSPTVYTPHMGEAKRLLGDDYSEGMTREEIVRELWKKLGGIAVLKGSGTLVFDGDELFVNTTGNRGMATAGSGDVLSGVMTSFLGQGISPLDVAVSAVYIHGLAGDMAKDEFGYRGLIARDLVKYIAYAIRNIELNL